jgi:hypothetical protein
MCRESFVSLLLENKINGLLVKKNYTHSNGKLV